MKAGKSRKALSPEIQDRHTAGSIVDNNLLCFWPHGTQGNNLTAELEAGGWSIFSADNPDMVKSLSTRHSIPVGMLFLDSDLPLSYLEGIYFAITASEDLVWVALLTDRRRMNDGVCNLIATCCNDFFTPPYDGKRILDSIGHAAGLARIRHRSLEYRGTPATFHGMIGQSPPMRRLFRQLRKVARSDAPVLLRGESGSGKELAASAIHRLSGRSSMPYVTVNCAALPSTLIQAELFGHEKGAFTGADKRRVGRFEAAQGGVVFLDEIGDMPMDQQVNLLRALEEKRIERLGGNGTVALNVRVVVATHEDLGEAVNRGTFREDLYYRLNVLSVVIPPLRDRGEDIELLANYMFEKFGTECEFHPVKGFNKQALKAMRSYHWPGNVRELINRVQSAVVMSDSSYISSSDLGFKELIETGRKSTLEYNRAKSDRLTVEAALRHNRDNISQAARELGISRTTLYRIMEKLAIQV